MHTIGEGSQGKVRVECYLGTCAAVKTIPIYSVSEEDIQREYRLCMKARHPNVVKYLCEPKREGPNWVIRMEYIEGHDLSKPLRNKEASFKARIINGMCEGLQHMHSLGIVHQDLKPANIMVDYKQCRAVIIDLGLAKIRSSANPQIYSGNDGWTPYYVAPEVRLRRAVSDRRADVWSMGKIIVELLLESTPIYPDDITPAWIERKLRGNPYCYIVKAMLDTNPENRLTMGKIPAAIRRAGEEFVNNRNSAAVWLLVFAFLLILAFFVVSRV